MENERKTKLAPRLDKRKTVLYVFLFILVVVFSVLSFSPQTSKNDQPPVYINGKEIKVNIARTDEQRTKGLSGHSGLRDDEGLLFVFEDPGNHCFWMKDMNFSIDIIWFDENQNLVHQERGVSPSTYPKSFCPETDTKYVIELKAGSAEELGLTEGQKIDLNKL